MSQVLEHTVCTIGPKALETVTQRHLCLVVPGVLRCVHVLVVFAYHLGDLKYGVEFEGEILRVHVVNLIVRVVDRFLRVLLIFAR